MPRYEYECTSCGQVLEVNQRMTDPPLTDCECGSKGSLRRLLSAGTGLIFKGSGFYITDYKNGNGSADTATKSSTESKPAKETAAPASTETKGHSCGGGCGCAS